MAWVPVVSSTNLRPSRAPVFSIRPRSQRVPQRRSTSRAALSASMMALRLPARSSAGRSSTGPARVVVRDGQPEVLRQRGHRRVDVLKVTQREPGRANVRGLLFQLAFRLVE